MFTCVKYALILWECLIFFSLDGNLMGIQWKYIIGICMNIQGNTVTMAMEYIYSIINGHILNE